MQSIDIFPWDDNFNTGLPKVDEQHRKLVQLLNLLASHVAFHSDLPQLSLIFDELAAYTVYHFETEEAIWNEYLPGDSSEIEHKQTHQKFIDTVLRLKSEQATKPLEQIAEEALGFLARWLASHILETDRQMAYVVLAMQDGLSLAEAKVRAGEQMSGATRVLIEIILSIYDTLSSNTLHLMREIAERKRREVELIEAKRHAEAANVAKSRFLGNMGHELRTPLNGIMGMAQLLMSPGVSETERQDYARTIHDSGESLLSLLNSILDLSAIEAGNLLLAPSACVIRQLLQEIQEQFAEAAQQKGLRLYAEVDEAVALNYQLDERRLRQMLSNLLSNALKFTQQGEIRLAIAEVEKNPDGSVLEFSVTDTGVGIPCDKQALLFQPFTQVDDSSTRQFGGAGLGLSIVCRLAQRMAGEVGMTSEVGQGSRIWFRIVAPAF